MEIIFELQHVPRQCLSSRAAERVEAIPSEARSNFAIASLIHAHLRFGT